MEAQINENHMINENILINIFFVLINIIFNGIFIYELSLLLIKIFNFIIDNILVFASMAFFGLELCMLCAIIYFVEKSYKNN